MPDRSRDGRARHDDARHELRENGRYGKGAFDDRHMERDRNYADRYREEDRYSDRPDRDRYASRDDHNERYNLRQSERGRVDRSDRNDRWEEPRGDWGRDWRDEPRERERDHRERERFEREERENREREDRERRKRFDQFDPEDRHDRNRHAEHSDRRERRSHQSGHARETFMSERSAPDVRQLSGGGRGDLQRRPDIHRRSDNRPGDRPKRLSGANDVQLGERRAGERRLGDRRVGEQRVGERRAVEGRARDRGGGDRRAGQRQRDRPRGKARFHGEARPDPQQNQKIAQDRQRPQVAVRDERQADQPPAESKEQVAPPATTALEVQKEPTDQAPEQAPEKGDEREDGEIGSESSESEECNSEADFDASDEEALPIAVAEKAAEGEPDEPGEPEAAAKEGEAKSASETNEVSKTEEAQGGLEAGPEAQQQVDHAQSEGSQRRDFSRTIPVPRRLSGEVKGVCSPGVQIQIRMPPEQSRTDPCLVSVSGTMEEVELAVRQIRCLHQKQRGASDSVEFHIPRDATGQRLLQRLNKETLRRTANVTLKIDDDKQEEYYKAVLSGQPKDTDRAWLVALKATLGKAD